MLIIAYIDVRPFIFLVGLPLFISIALLVCWIAKANVSKSIVAIISSVLFTLLFTVLLTSVGPFVDQKDTRSYLMTWEVIENPDLRTHRSEVLLTFVDYPDHYIGEYSDELAAHLQTIQRDQVEVVFHVTSDYGIVRGFNPSEIAGLTSWDSEGGYAGVSGFNNESPWD